MRQTTVTLPEIEEGDYSAVALNGIPGVEGAYCIAEIDGKLLGFPESAPAYRANMWEYIVVKADRNYTYYLPLDKSASGTTVRITVLFTNGGYEEMDCDVWSRTLNSMNDIEHSGNMTVRIP